MEVSRSTLVVGVGAALVVCVHLWQPPPVRGIEQLSLAGLWVSRSVTDAWWSLSETSFVYCAFLDEPPTAVVERWPNLGFFELMPAMAQPPSVFVPSDLPVRFRTVFSNASTSGPPFALIWLDEPLTAIVVQPTPDGSLLFMSMR